MGAAKRQGDDEAAHVSKDGAASRAYARMLSLRRHVHEHRRASAGMPRSGDGVVPARAGRGEMRIYRFFS
jgi:hypothetical protein